MELKTNISVVFIYFSYNFTFNLSITPRTHQLMGPRSLIANKKTLSSCRSFFVVSGVRKRPIARSILALSESVLKFRTVNFLANYNF